MNGQKYERRVASYLRYKGYKGVTITQASGDYGVDIVASKHFHKYAIQCKYYSKPVGLSAVQQVVAGMAYYECDRAIVITNNTFTRQAKQLAKHNDVELMANVNPSNMVFLEILLKIIPIVALYLLYKMGYEIIVYLYILLVVMIFVLSLYIKYQFKKNNNSDDEYIEENDELSN